MESLASCLETCQTETEARSEDPSLASPFGPLGIHTDQTDCTAIVHEALVAFASGLFDVAASCTVDSAVGAVWLSLMGRSVNHDR